MNTVLAVVVPVPIPPTGVDGGVERPLSAEGLEDSDDIIQRLFLLLERSILVIDRLELAHGDLDQRGDELDALLPGKVSWWILVSTDLESRRPLTSSV